MAGNAEQADMALADMASEILMCTYEWYMCRYAPDHQEDIGYVWDTYQHTWEQTAEFFEKLSEDPQRLQEECLKKILEKSETDQEKLMKELEDHYVQALKERKEPAHIYDGRASYKRIMPKVGRNDPCPCGSGKKYKKCCGR